MGLGGRTTSARTMSKSGDGTEDRCLRASLHDAQLVTASREVHESSLLWFEVDLDRQYERILLLACRSSAAAEDEIPRDKRHCCGNAELRHCAEVQDMNGQEQRIYCGGKG